MLGLRCQIHQNRRLMAQNARIKSAFCKPRLTKKFLSAWTQVPDSPKSAADGTERKDQICVLQTKTASEPFTIRNILSEGSEVQRPLASDHQIRAPVIISKTASENQTRFLCYGFLGFYELVLMMKPTPKRHFTSENSLLRRGSVSLSLGDGRP